MKFARYLEDNCTPEWKRAYIDYRRLKKCIKAIQARQQAQDPSTGADGAAAAAASGSKPGRTGLGNGAHPITSGEESVDDGLDELDSSDREDLGPSADLRPLPPSHSRSSQNGPGGLRRNISSLARSVSGDKKWWNRLDRPRPIEASNMEASRSTERVHEAVGSVDRVNSKRAVAIGAQEDPDHTRGDKDKESEGSMGLGRQRSTSEAGYGSMGTSPALKGSSIGRKSNPVQASPRTRIHSLSNTPRIDRPRSPLVPPELHLPDSTYPGEMDGNGNEDSGDQLEDPPWSAVSHSDSVNSATGLRPRHSQPSTEDHDRSGSPYYLSTPGQNPRLSSSGTTPGGPSRKRQEETEALGRSETRTTAADSSSGDEDGNLVSKLPSPLLHAKSPVGGRSPRLGGLGTKTGLGKSSTFNKDASSNKREEVPGTGPTTQASGTGGAIYARRFGGGGGVAPRFPESLQELQDICNTEEKRFFSTLDNELEKVEAFYHDRETDALRRSKELKQQLDELAEHRRIFHEAEEERMNEGKVKKYIGDAVEGVQKRIPFVASVIQIADPKASGSTATTSALQNGNGNGMKQGEMHDSETGKERSSLETDQNGTTSNVARNRTPLHERTSFDPEKYQRYKKKLRTAIIEFYKELEILKNYRILNITGFKKALKKFEKTARVKCIDLYMDGKVSKRSFADGRTVDRLLKQMEDEFTLRFEKGDHKKAVGRLRGQFITKTHHLSTFSSGTYIGIGLPIMILGLVEALRDQTRRNFPQVEALLLVYSALFLPVLFGMLFELNLAAFVAARINYGFIMELDIRTAIDHRQFLEIPAMLFAALALCFYFSVHQVGEPVISPYAWPIVWIVGTVTFFLNPIPVYFQHARYWLLSVLGRVFTPGYSRVEFIAFFVADELNSLTYSIGHLWTIGCAYNRHWPPDTLSVCRTSGSWVFGLLVCVPAFIRFVQCLKRFKDSRLKIHLVNAGKYVSSMLQLALFTYWRSRGSQIHDHSFAIWATAAVLTSSYTSSWDLLVDWGLLRPHAGYLRESLGYPSLRPYYYVAMVSNVIVRFIWVFYIPKPTTDVPLKSFIFATMEMLRRWQWNFFRVETEQVGNTDQYRVTREVPLPYRIIRDEDGDEDEPLARKRTRQQANGFGLRSTALRLGHWREKVLAKRAAKGLPDRTINAGPRGDDDNREYSPRQDDGMPVLPVASPDRMSLASNEIEDDQRRRGEESP